MCLNFVSKFLSRIYLTLFSPKSQIKTALHKESRSRLKTFSQTNWFSKTSKKCRVKQFYRITLISKFILIFSCFLVRWYNHLSLLCYASFSENLSVFFSYIFNFAVSICLIVVPSRTFYPTRVILLIFSFAKFSVAC